MGNGSALESSPIYSINPQKTNVNEVGSSHAASMAVKPSLEITIWRLSSEVMIDLSRSTLPWSANVTFVEPYRSLDYFCELG